MLKTTENKIDQITLWISHRFQNKIIKILPKILIEIVIANELYLDVIMLQTLDDFINYLSKHKFKDEIELKQLLIKYLDVEDI